MNSSLAVDVVSCQLSLQLHCASAHLFFQGSGSTVSGGAAETEGQLQLPSLEGGKKASSLINPYMQAALQRATKLGMHWLSYVLFPHRSKLMP